MSTVFVLQNQFKHLLNKQKAWTSGRDARTLYSTPHKDEAINLMFELSSKDFGLRVDVLEVALKEGKLPKLTVSQIALPGLEDDEEENSEPALENPV